MPYPFSPSLAAEARIADPPRTRADPVPAATTPGHSLSLSPGLTSAPAEAQWLPPGHTHPSPPKQSVVCSKLPFRKVRFIYKGGAGGSPLFLHTHTYKISQLP